MSYRTIECHTKGPIGFLHLNRPEAMNAIDEHTEQELIDACRRAGEDERVKALVVASKGEGAFSVGIDLRRLEDDTAGGDPNVVAELRRRLSGDGAWKALAAVPKPTIAAIRGAALGAGLELALACDIRIASGEATFGFPEVRLGLIPSHGGTQRLPRIVGRAKAIEMILSGEPIDAAEAYRVELVSQVVPVEELLTVAEAMAAKLATHGPIALRFAREAIARGSDMTFDQGLHLEMDLYALLQTTHDRAEGIRSFKEKRPPKFEGR